jgi:dsDNA-binding SOS-regulon protein
LKKTDQFAWTAEAQEALDKVKDLLTKAPILFPLTKKESLLLYIAATTHVFSTALVVEREEAGHTLKVQHPIYFINEVLANSKIHYP